MKRNRFTRQQFTAEFAAKGGPAIVYHLNGGSKTLAKLINQHVTKTGQTKDSFARAAGVSTQPFYRYISGKSGGISLQALRGFAKALDTSAFKLGKKLHLAPVAKAKVAAKVKPKKKMPSLNEVMDALGVGQTDLACSVVIGNDRLTVERMKGQEHRPVVVEHGGHRFTIEQA